MPVLPLSRRFSDGPRSDRASWTQLAVFAAVAGAIAALLLWQGPKLREEASDGTCRGKLKQLGLAVLNFRDYYGCWPPASIPDDNGKPMHSWRVLILPFLDF